MFSVRLFLNFLSLKENMMILVAPGYKISPAVALLPNYHPGTLKSH